MTKTIPLALIALLLAAPAVRAQVARKAVPSDDRITDATPDFYDTKYPAGPVASMTFWGFIGAKTDESADQDRLCDMDVAELASNAALAGKRARAKPGEIAVSKTIVTSKAEWCDGRESPKGQPVQPETCNEYTVKHCAAVVSSRTPKLRVQYKSMVLPGTDRACRAALVAEMESSSVIDSTILPLSYRRGETGCALKVLELVKTK